MADPGPHRRDRRGDLVAGRADARRGGPRGHGPGLPDPGHHPCDREQAPRGRRGRRLGLALAARSRRSKRTSSRSSSSDAPVYPVAGPSYSHPRPGHRHARRLRPGHRRHLHRLHRAGLVALAAPARLRAGVPSGAPARGVARLPRPAYRDRVRPLAVFDLDGSLADVAHRLHHLERRPGLGRLLRRRPRDPPLADGLALVRESAPGLRRRLPDRPARALPRRHRRLAARPRPARGRLVDAPRSATTGPPAWPRPQLLRRLAARPGRRGRRRRRRAGLRRLRGAGLDGAARPLGGAAPALQRAQEERGPHLSATARAPAAPGRPWRGPRRPRRRGRSPR